MKKFILVPVFATGLALVPLGASAQGGNTADVRAYLGGGIGYYRLNDDNFLDEDESLKDDRFSWRGFAGFEVNRIFALEAGYVDFGSTSEGNRDMEADGWTLAAIAALPITPYFAPYAKVGQLFWDRERSFGPLSSSDDGNDFFFGGGARFAMTDNIDLRLEYERYALDDTDLDMGSVNVQFRF